MLQVSINDSVFVSYRSHSNRWVDTVSTIEVLRAYESSYAPRV